MTKKFIVLTALAACFVLGAAAQAQDSDGEGPRTETIARNCTGCHGPDGKSPGAIPTLAGKAADYLAERMMQLRNGTRESTVMNRILKGFADEDIRKMADYFAKRD
jgi:cytochrome c553